MIEGQEGVTWEQWLRIAGAAEEAGLDGLFRSDHYGSIHRGDRLGSLDAWTVLAGLAARTERLRLGTLVSPVTFRPASVLAKSAVTVDHISGGRAELGIGAGWLQAEHELHGFPFPSTRERMEELERQLAEIRRQWSDEAPEIQPKPVQRPRMPIIVGGTAGPRTVRAAARFADEYNTVMPSVDEARERRQIVDEAARAAGRGPLTLSMMIDCVTGRDAAEVAERLDSWRRITGRKDARPNLCGTVDELCGRLRDYERAGIERAMLQHLDHEDVDMVAVLGDVAAELA
jgi:alkanesulfonate monooxygenase SsuD/methylene tetrahydromethanopterin reductase-like flavin-dependent oxidoreductase (luciferase family)